MGELTLAVLCLSQHTNIHVFMGFTSCMKTVEVTRSKNLNSGIPVKGTMSIFIDTLRASGIRGIYRGVNAVALRQITNWSSRIGISRFAEDKIRTIRGKSTTQPLSVADKILASAIGGALSCWNQPFEVSWYLGCVTLRQFEGLC